MLSRKFSASAAEAGGAFGKSDLISLLAADGGWFFSAYDSGSLYQSSDTSTAVSASGQTVGRWSDLSGNGHHVNTTNASYEPTYTESGAARYLQFTNNLLTGSTGGVTGSGARWIVAVVQDCTVNGGTEIICGTGSNTTGEHYGLTYRANSNTAFGNIYWAETNFGNSTTEIHTDSGIYVIGNWYDGTDDHHRVNGVEDGSTTIALSGTGTDLAIGSHVGGYNGGNASTVKIHNIVGLNDEPTAQEIADIEAYLLSEAGVTLPSPAINTQPLTAESTAETITIPAGVSVGDVAVLFDYPEHSGSLPTKVVPTDWTEIDSDDNGSDERFVVSYKIIESGDASSSVTGMTGSDQNNKVMLVFSGTSAFTSVVAGSLNLEMTTGNPVSQTVTASSGAKALVTLGCAGRSRGAATFSTEPAWNGTFDSTSADLATGWRVHNGDPYNATIDKNDEGPSNVLFSCYLELS